MPKKTIDAVPVRGRRVLIRLDLNVPLEGGAVADDRRIREALPTIRSVIDRGGRAILISHLGRPDGRGYQAEYSLEPVARHLSGLLGRPVAFPSHDCIDEAARRAVESMADGEVVLLENLRFHEGETAGDASLAAKLAAYADVYVNDAFGTCHRPHASMVALPEAMADRPRVAGFLVQKEIRYLSEAIRDPARPLAVVLGGAKVSDKIGAIENLLRRADDVLIGGAMAYTFLAALGRPVGDSRVERESIPAARRAIDLAAELEHELYLPEDHVCGTSFTRTGGDIEVFEGSIRPGYIGMDIGPKTQGTYRRVIRGAKTIVWNGPMGVFEWPPFAVGTQQVARAIADATDAGATSIVGGGDTAAAVEKFGLAERMTHVSTGGGASLELLEGKSFRALELLEDA